MMSDVYHEMLAELQSHRLEVCLAPAKRDAERGAMVRCVLDQNVTWYRRLCARHLSSRVRRKVAADTRVRRANIERILSRLAEGKTSVSKYASELKAEALRRNSAVAA